MALLSLSYLGAQAFEPELDEGVIVLGTSNFDAAIAYYDNLLVEFYAPWCGHCKSLAPEYAKAAATLAKLDPPQYVAKVDATENEALAQRFEVQGFPTLHFFKNGQKTEYNGGRTEDTIVQWIKKKTGPPSEELTGSALVAKVGAVKKAVAFVGATDSALYAAHVAAAKDPQISESFEFYHTTDETVAADLGLSGPGLVVIRSFDAQLTAYSGDANKESIVAFVASKASPILINFSEDDIEPIFQKKQPALMLFSNDSTQDYQQKFADAALALNGQILFVKSTTTDGIQQRLAEYVGVDASQTPTIKLIQLGDDLMKYNYTGAVAEITTESLQAFINEFKAGTLPLFLKSEPVPETNDGPVKTVVGTQWNEIVGDTTKDVFVKYYAPWCGHCKSLAPIWTELGEYVAGLDIVIAEMDSTLNEVQGVSIRGFPTLIYYPKDNKSGVNYEGGRELQDFKDYLSANSAAYKGSVKIEEEL